MYKQGSYGTEIAKRLVFQNSKVWSITRKLKRKGLISLKSKGHYNIKYYKLTPKGELLLSSLTEEKQEDQPKKKARKSSLWPYGLIEFGIHAIRYKQPLIHKPGWLYQITKIAQHDGVVVKRVILNNWDKFLIQLHNYKNYNGIDNIEICNNIVIYNFRLTLEDSLVSTIEELDSFKEERIKGCVQGRQKLEQIGFELGSDEEIDVAQKFHYVLKTEDTLRYNDIGDFIIAHIKDDKRTIMHDHSPEVGPAEIEIDNETDVKEVLEAPKKVQQIEDDMSDLKEDVSDLKNSTSDLKDAMSQILRSQTELNTSMKSLIDIFKGKETQDQNQPHKEGMYL